MKPCQICGVTTDCFHRPVCSPQYKRDFKEWDYAKAWNDALCNAQNVLSVELNDNDRVRICAILERIKK